MSEKCEIIIANGLETRVWTHHPTYGYGCAECCNGDRCDEDCDAKYRRPNCPHCGGSGWIKKDDADTPPTTEEAELWKEMLYPLFVPEDIEHLVPGLIERYRLTRRSEQNSEAIEFGYWLHKHDHGSDNHDRIDKLYEQFKQKQREPEPATPGQWYARLEGCKTPEDVDELEKRHADVINANPDLRRLFVIYKFRLKNK